MCLEHIYDAGVYLYEQERYEEAAKLFRSIMKDYETLGAVFSFGCCLIELDKYEEAIALFKKMLIACPNWENVWFKLGYTYIRSNCMDEALICLLKAEEIAPKHPRVLFYLGLYYEKAKEFGKAIKYYKRSLEIENTSGINASLSVCHYAIRKYEEALKYAKKAYHLEPNCIDNLFYYTRLLVVNEKYKDCFDILNSTQLNYEDNKELLITYIICSLRIGNTNNADVAYTRLQKVDNTSRMVLDYESIRESYRNTADTSQ